MNSIAVRPRVSEYVLDEEPVTATTATTSYDVQLLLLRRLSFSIFTPCALNLDRSVPRLHISWRSAAQKRLSCLYRWLGGVLLGRQVMLFFPTWPPSFPIRWLASSVFFSDSLHFFLRDNRFFNVFLIFCPSPLTWFRFSFWLFYGNGLTTFSWCVSRLH